MTDATVTVNNLNLAQGSFNEIERTALFLGVGSLNVGQVLSLNTQSELDSLIDSDLLTLVSAAKDNGGENWEAFALPLVAAVDWEEALNTAMATVSPELVVICDPMTTQAAIQDIKTAMETLRTEYARRCIALIATAGIDSGSQTWTDYETEQITLQDGIAAERVALVPLLHGNDVGILAGRLCRREVSIADSPQRVKTGSLFSLGDLPSDVDGVLLSDATLANLRGNRLNCIKRYIDYDGTYWGNFNTLDAEAGDYQNGEWLRIADKAARRVRILAITLIDDRAINASAVSLQYTKNILLRPLMEMSRSAVVNGVPFPGEIDPPSNDAIVINWISKTAVDIYIVIKPKEAPKTITINILLDLTAPASET